MESTYGQWICSLLPLLSSMDWRIGIQGSFPRHVGGRVHFSFLSETQTRLLWPGCRPASELCTIPCNTRGTAPTNKQSWGSETAAKAVLYFSFHGLFLYLSHPLVTLHLSHVSDVWVVWLMPIKTTSTLDGFDVVRAAWSQVAIHCLIGNVL